MVVNANVTKWCQNLDDLSVRPVFEASRVTLNIKISSSQRTLYKKVKNNMYTYEERIRNRGSKFMKKKIQNFILMIPGLARQFNKKN